MPMSLTRTPGRPFKQHGTNTKPGAVHRKTLLKSACVCFSKPYSTGRANLGGPSRLLEGEGHVVAAQSGAGAGAGAGAGEDLEPPADGHHPAGRPRRARGKRRARRRPRRLRRAALGPDTLRRLRRRRRAPTARTLIDATFGSLRRQPPIRACGPRSRLSKCSIRGWTDSRSAVIGLSLVSALRCA